MNGPVATVFLEGESGSQNLVLTLQQHNDNNDSNNGSNKSANTLSSVYDQFLLTSHMPLFCR